MEAAPIIIVVLHHIAGMTARLDVPKEKCFFQLPDMTFWGGSGNIQLVFKNNSANTAGNMLYGGTIDNCKLITRDNWPRWQSNYVFDFGLVHHQADNTNSSISSDPFRIRQCESNHPDWDISDKTLSLYPGETFQASVVAVGQRHGTVPSRVVSMIVEQWLSQGHLPDSQHLQQANNTCTKLNYTVLSHSETVYIDLNPDDSPCSAVFAAVKYTLEIQVYVEQNCPHGFSPSTMEKSCVCEPRLAKYTDEHKCTITNGVGSITRDSDRKFWVGYDQSHGLILNSLCPFDYCVSQAVNFSLNNTDMQCAKYRSRHLCGACKNGYSLVLGTSDCKQCTNSHLTLLIPFAVMGVALVFLLLVCKLTVATGTLSGLVFYANIVGVNDNIFLPVKSTDALSVFIAGP